MTDMKQLTEGHTPVQHHYVRCPVTGRPLYDIQPAGIISKCRSCGNGTAHITTWEEIDRERSAMEKREE